MCDNMYKTNPSRDTHLSLSVQFLLELKNTLSMWLTFGLQPLAEVQGSVHPLLEVVTDTECSRAPIRSHITKLSSGHSPRGKQRSSHQEDIAGIWRSFVRSRRQKQTSVWVRLSLPHPKASTKVLSLRASALKEDVKQ